MPVLGSGDGVSMEFSFLFYGKVARRRQGACFDIG